MALVARVRGRLASMLAAGQAAFLPGRRISDNAQLPQLLPDLRHLRGCHGAIALPHACDTVGLGLITAG